MNHTRPTRVTLLCLALTALLGGPLHGQEAGPRVELHGFGSWAYGRTNGNEYLSGDQRGRYDDASFALIVTASVTDHLFVTGQAFWVDGPAGTEAELDSAFAEWTFSDKLKLRAGKVKLPFGISTEVFDVGTLRPFLALPQVVYGPAGILGEAYTGVGLTGFFELKGAWGLRYDAFGGGQHLEEFSAPEAVARGRDVEEATEPEITRDMVGGHLLVETPLRGLQFGGSFYTGRDTTSAHRTGVGLQAEYEAGPWTIRSEYAHERVTDDLKLNALYGEVGYHLDSHWQAAAQYGRLSTDLAGLSSPKTSSLLRHEEIAAGLNYWWSPDFVFKLSFHHVDGNRFAGPDPRELAAAVAAGRLKEKTNLVLFGAQFSF
jgi:hypothetical protein